MKLVCLDLEGVLIPEIWITVANHTSIEELKLTTRDITNYDELMDHRLSVLKKHNITLTDIQDIIMSMDVLPGACDFLDTLRQEAQLIIITDSFNQFVKPVLPKLNFPTIFTNTLNVDKLNRISGYTLRHSDGKRVTVQALQKSGIKVFAAGDSYNDISMLKAADTSLLFRPPASIRDQFPEIETVNEYNPLLMFIRGFLNN